MFSRKYQPVLIDPNWLERYGWPEPMGYWTETVATTDTRPIKQSPVDEDRIRRIVREEIAQLPIQFDVPDSLPES